MIAIPYITPTAESRKNPIIGRLVIRNRDRLFPSASSIRCAKNEAGTRERTNNDHTTPKYPRGSSTAVK
jgi:hypothetical protein